MGRFEMPSFAEEMMLQAQGYRYIAGVDEVGRGALAGPVMAAAVILPCQLDVPWLSLVKDSKELSPDRRKLLFDHIRRTAIAIGIGSIPGDIIDVQGIVRATQLAMKSAIDQLSPPPQVLLIDYMHLPGTDLPQKGIVDGDNLCFSIACASIIAKVTRDKLMVELDKTYPGYGLAGHKGYGTAEHVACLRRLGPSPIHRRTFQPVKDMAGK